MFKKFALGFLIINLISSCVNNSNIVIPNISASPGSVMPTGSVNSPQTSSPLPQVTPTPLVMPTAISSPVIIPTPVVSSNPISQIKYNYSSSIDNTYTKITDQIITDTQKEAEDLSKLVTELNLSTPTIQLEQNLVDPEYRSDREFINWKAYDDIFNSFNDNNKEVIIKIDYTKPLTGNSVPTVSKYIDFINLFIERYSTHKMSWIFGEEINDSNHFNGGFNNYVETLRRTSEAIKRKTPSAKVYMGSLSQAEIFGEKRIRILDDLLAFINLGADKYVDGFTFEIFSLDNQSIDIETASSYKYTDYNIIKSYATLINDFLQERGLQSKERLLVTGTYGGDLVSGIAQSEEQQANDIFRRIIVGMAGGFSKVILPQIYDQTRDAPSTFFKRLGVLRDDSDSEKRKLAYWTYRFTNTRLKDSFFVNKIESPLKKVEIYLFENNESKLYIIWNTDKNFFGAIDLNLDNTNEGTFYITPSQDNKNGASLQVSPNGKYRFGFESYNLNPRILEIKK